MERPILYSTDMVQALLDNRKSKTRRTNGLDEINETINLFDFHASIVNNKGCYANFKNVVDGTITTIKCPYGKPGDLLWVRENWQLKGWCFDDGEMQINYQAGGHLWVDIHDPKEDSSWLQNQIEKLENAGVLVMSETDEDYFEFTDKPQPWKPNIHMPKEAARIWLKVADVRVERLQDISEDDAIAEGIEVGPTETDPFSRKSLPTYKIYTELNRFVWASPVVSFKSLWESINGADSWKANPWVWVVEFEVVSTTGVKGMKEVNP